MADFSDIRRLVLIEPSAGYTSVYQIGSLRQARMCIAITNGEKSLLVMQAS